MLERMEKFKHFFTTFLRGAFGPGAGSCYLRGTLRRACCAGAYSVPRGSRPPGPPHAAAAWSNWEDTSLLMRSVSGRTLPPPPHPPPVSVVLLHRSGPI